MEDKNNSHVLIKAYKDQKCERRQENAIIIQCCRKIVIKKKMWRKKSEMRICIAYARHSIQLNMNLFKLLDQQMLYIVSTPTTSTL